MAASASPLEREGPLRVRCIARFAVSRLIECDQAVIRRSRTIQLVAENITAKGIAMNHKERHFSLSAFFNR